MHYSTLQLTYYRHLRYLQLFSYVIHKQFLIIDNYLNICILKRNY